MRILGGSCTVWYGIGQYWTVLDGIGQYWTVLDSIGQYWTVLDGIGRSHLDPTPVTGIRNQELGIRNYLG